MPVHPAQRLGGMMAGLGASSVCGPADNEILTMQQSHQVGGSFVLLGSSGVCEKLLVAYFATKHLRVATAAASSVLLGPLFDTHNQNRRQPSHVKRPLGRLPCQRETLSVSGTRTRETTELPVFKLHPCTATSPCPLTHTRKIPGPRWGRLLSERRRRRRGDVSVGDR